MMKIFFKQILFILISGIIVIASGGFSLVHHYCSCTNDFNIAILDEKSCCHDEGKDQQCANMPDDEKYSCCSAEKKESATNHKHCTDGSHCCSFEYFYLKTDSFDFSGKKRISLEFIISYLAVINDVKDDNSLWDSYQQLLNHNLPPPDYGKKLLFSLHQIKIPTPLV
ncbi:MAG: hypothetical protein R2764_16255 [Bacteroidales bacterium]